MQLLLEAQPDLAVVQPAWAGDTPLHSAAIAGQVEAVRLLLIRMDPGTPGIARSSDGCAPVRAVVVDAGGLLQAGHIDAMRLLLAAAPAAALAGPITVLHEAAYWNCLEAVQLLLAHAPLPVRQAALQAALQPDDEERRPLQVAAFGCWKFFQTLGEEEAEYDLGRALPVLHALLAADPGAALELDVTGMSALHHVAAIPTAQHLAFVQALLTAAPGAVEQTDDDGLTALHHACAAGCVPVVQRLLAACPEALMVPSEDGRLPLHLAAAAGHAEVASRLVHAAQHLPAGGAFNSALARTSRGQTALHLAAAAGQPAAVRVLMEAEPAAAQLLDSEQQTSLACALRGVALNREDEFLEVARCLLAAGPADAALATLVGHLPQQEPSRTAMCSLFADLVVARPAFTLREWPLMPSPCPGLGRALPTALERSPEQAAHLVARLPPADAQRLRMSALALHRAQARRRIRLPPELAWRVLAQFHS